MTADLTTDKHRLHRWRRWSWGFLGFNA